MPPPALRLSNSNTRRRSPLSMDSSLPYRLWGHDSLPLPTLLGGPKNNSDLHTLPYQGEAMPVLRIHGLPHVRHMISYDII